MKKRELTSTGLQILKEVEDSRGNQFALLGNGYTDEHQAVVLVRNTKADRNNWWIVKVYTYEDGMNTINKIEKM